METGGDDKKSKKLDETILNERIDARGNPSRTHAQIYETKSNGEKFIRLSRSNATKSGKWYFSKDSFLLGVKDVIGLVKSFFRWAQKYNIDAKDLNGIRSQPTEALSEELKVKEIELEKAEQTIEKLKIELSKREDEFRKQRDNDFFQRIDEYKKQIEYFETLINDFEKNKKKEEDLQAFLEEHSWFLGLYYTDFKPQKWNSMDRYDFYLKRFDGSEEIIELKRVDAEFVTKDGEISSDFAKALDQMLNYFDDVIDTASSTRTSKKYGIHEFYPKGILVFGFKTDEKTKSFVNKWSHAIRIEIITYSQVLDKFKVTVSNLEKMKVV
ncbi:hypothetical protein EPN87_03610 [archaeon]|nr:MAG: hypothetical protein EPN87_03610 [archaeon]